jgi:hypothetical protein
MMRAVPFYMALISKLGQMRLSLGARATTCDQDRGDCSPVLRQSAPQALGGLEILSSLDAIHRPNNRVQKKHG